jgi:TfoX/Sxy family transcriptional regulator of competence genes
MASDKARVEAIADQLRGAGEIRVKPMFGEYGVYCDEIFVATICDNHLFVKASLVGSRYLDDSNLAPPYPGAKDAYRVPEDRLQDADWLEDFVRTTTAALPKPKPRPKKPA